MTETSQTYAPFTKTVRIGTGPDGDVFCKITFSKDGKLSISGVEGPKANGDCRGSCGQIVMSEWDIKDYAPGWDKDLEQQFRAIWKEWHLNDMTPGCEHQKGPEWTSKEVSIYHFNLTVAIINAQNAIKDAAHDAIRAGQPFVPTEDQAKIFALPFSITSHLPTPPTPEYYVPAKQTTYSRPVETKQTEWLNEAEHPDGFLSKPCPVCGYKYGSAWLKREVSAEALAFLKGLPDTDLTPAWV